MSTIIIGFGYKARRGKDTACNAIMDARSPVKRYAFADALRIEINETIQERFRRGCSDPQAAMMMLCSWAGVPYETTVMYDSSYPYGKQRALTQWWGTEYRRTQDPDYWVKRLKERIERDTPRVAIISDLRMHNEYEFVQRNAGYCVRVDRPGFEIADGKHHISETLLDSLPDDAWDHILVNDQDEATLKSRAIDFFDEVTA